MTQAESGSSPRRWLPFVLLALAPFAVDCRDAVSGLREYAHLPKSVYAHLLCACALVWMWARAVRERRLGLPGKSLLLPFCAFAAWSLASLLWAPNRWEGAGTWSHWALCALAWPALAAVVRTRDDALRWTAALFWSGAGVSLIGLLQVAGILAPDAIPQAVQPASTFGHKNFAAQYVLLTIPLGAAAWAYGGDRRCWLRALGCAVSCAYLFHASARAAWVAAACQVLLWGALMLKDQGLRPAWTRHRALSGLAAVILVVIAAQWSRPDLARKYGGASERVTAIAEGIAGRGAPGTGGGADRASVSSVRLRLIIWRNTLEMIKDHPMLGTGLGNHKVLYPAYSRKAVVDSVFRESERLSFVHNDYLQLLAETGPVGLALFIWLAAALARLWLRVLDDLSEGERPGALAIGLAFAGIAVNACFSFPMHRSLPPLALMALLGVLTGLGRNAAGETSFRIQGLSRHRWTALVVAAALTIAAWEYRRVMAEQLYSRAEGAVKAGDWAGVIEKGKSAYRYNPGRKKLLYPVGTAYARTGRAMEGAQLLESVVRAYPHDFTSLLNLGLAYSSIGRFADALDCFERAKRIKPDYPKVHNAMGLAYMRSSRPSKARDAFKTASELAPRNPRYAFRWGAAALAAKDHPSARRGFARAAALDPAVRKSVPAGMLEEAPR